MTISTLYAFAKSLHLIGMVSWMAGMFYLVRIMVYHAMALEQTGPQRDTLAQQYTVMEWKSYRIILVPAVFITWTFGVLMLFLQPAWLREGWLQLKLLFLVVLTGYTLYLKKHIRQLETGASGFTHIHYRALNEVPTIFLAAIVFLAVFRNGVNYVALFIGLAVFTGLIAWGIWKANRKN